MSITTAAGEDDAVANPDPRYHFHAGFREELKLADGTPVVLRPIRVTDREMIAKGFARLSPESRYLRFFTGKDKLSAKELKYLTDCDGEDHFALGVVRLEGGVEAEGMAVGRFVRLDPGGVVAEPAITVVDAYQGKGLGTLLLHRLSAAARERGIERFFTEFLSDNEKIRHMITETAPGAVIREREGVVCAEFPVPEADASVLPSEIDHQSIVQRVMSSHAAGEVLIRIRRSVLKRPR